MGTKEYESPQVVEYGHVSDIVQQVLTFSIMQFELEG